MAKAALGFGCAKQSKNRKRYLLGNPSTAFSIGYPVKRDLCKINWSHLLFRVEFRLTSDLESWKTLLTTMSDIVKYVITPSISIFFNFSHRNFVDGRSNHCEIFKNSNGNPVETSWNNLSSMIFLVRLKFHKITRLNIDLVFQLFYKRKNTVTATAVISTYEL